MDSATLALWGVGALWALFAAWVWISCRFMENASKIHSLLRDLNAKNGDRLTMMDSRVHKLEETQRILLGADKTNVAYLNKLDERVAGVEALLVSTVGQETEDFCRAMDALMDKMEKSEERQEPAPKLTLSEEYVGKFGKKGARNG